MCRSKKPTNVTLGISEYLFLCQYVAEGSLGLPSQNCLMRPQRIVVECALLPLLAGGYWKNDLARELFIGVLDINVDSVSGTV